MAAARTTRGCAGGEGAGAVALSAARCDAALATRQARPEAAIGTRGKRPRGAQRGARRGASACAELGGRAPTRTS